MASAWCCSFTRLDVDALIDAKNQDMLRLFDEVLVHLLEGHDAPNLGNFTKQNYTNLGNNLNYKNRHKNLTYL